MISLVVVYTGLMVTTAVGQRRLFPTARSFELPEASPRVYGLVGRLISARQGDSRFGQEHEGEVVLGENFPLITLQRGDRPIVLGLGSQVYGRFSLTDSKSALISTDWVVGVNTTAAFTPWILTLEMFHESSHLGDEYGDRFPADRLDWTREVVAGWASYVTDSWRFTAGTSYSLVDQLKLPAWGGSFGIDYHGRSRGFLGGQVRPIVAVFTEARAATNWRVSTSAKLGLAFATDGTQDISIGLIAHDGLSTQRQFYRHESQYIGLELRFDL
ncbi:MAG TPA: DUF1207 domain-containing protein [Gemmatimonadales bacterium]|nr:DUF1207 domain-containing protein [Gemmatimonadales bacterium]